jgi:F-type H+-transporting ATPase subunit c
MNMNPAMIGAGIAVLAGFGSAVGIGIAAGGGSQAIAIKPEKEKSIRMITFLGIIMGSACSIYGLLIALIIIPNGDGGMSLIGAGIAALASAGAAVGIGIAASGGCLATARQPEKEKSIRMITFLGIVLAEACAIYGLLIAFIIISNGGSDGSLIGAGIAGVAAAGAAIGIGTAASQGSHAIARQPEQEKSIRMITFLGIVLAEACAIYGLLIAFIIIGNG